MPAFSTAVDVLTNASLPPVDAGWIESEQLLHFIEPLDGTSRHLLDSLLLDRRMVG